MNTDIVEYLVDCWEEVGGVFTTYTKGGFISYVPKENRLYISNGSEAGGYYVNIRDLQHLLLLEVNI